MIGILLGKERWRRQQIHNKKHKRHEGIHTKPEPDHYARCSKAIDFGKHIGKDISDWKENNR